MDRRWENGNTGPALPGIHLLDTQGSFLYLYTTMTYAFFAQSPRYVEELLADEIASFGAESVKPALQGVYFRGPLETAYRACLWSRLANRILLPLANFPAETPEELYTGAREIAWNDHMNISGTFAVEASLSSSKLTHTDYTALKVKDAIADRLRDDFGSRPDVDVKRPDVRVHVRVFKDRATVSLDLSGDSLHRRGYRVASGRATLKENIAAAMLIRAGWKEIAAAGGSFVDPMCGTGTLPIEAALMASDTAPGIFREYWGFNGWKEHLPAIWRNLMQEAVERRVSGMRHFPVIIASDRDQFAVQAAERNSRAAGLKGRIRIEKIDFRSIVPPAGSRPGLVAVNPPYGERLGEVETLKPVYHELGKLLLERFKGWHASVLSGSEELSREIALKVSKVHSLDNGPIRCVLTHYELGSGFREKADRRENKPAGTGQPMRIYPEEPSRNTGGRDREPGKTERKISPALRAFLEETPDAEQTGDRQETHRRRNEGTAGRRPPSAEQVRTPTRKPAQEKIGSTEKKTAGATAPGYAEKMSPEKRKVTVKAIRTEKTPDSETGSANRGTGTRETAPDEDDPGPLQENDGNGDEKPDADGIEMLRNRMNKNRKHIGRWARKNGITCFRVYDADLPEYNAAIDVYEGKWVYLQEYAAPDEIPQEKADARFAEIQSIIPGVLAVQPENIFTRQRKKQKGTDQYEKIADTGVFREANENGLKFLVNFTDYLDTGLFLDHRITRNMIRDLAPGTRFLNLFAYTCSATVYAAAGGASFTTSVDNSNTYLEWGEKNMKLNGYSGSMHRYIREDCLKWLREEKGRYDLIFLDPPTFSNSRRMEGTLDIQRDHDELIRSSSNLLTNDGVLVFSTNFRKFRMNTDSLRDFSLQDITKETIPQDFLRNQRIHACWLIRKK